MIDPSTQAKTREKENKMWSVIEEYEDFGLYFMPGNNERLAGINRVREFLTVREKRVNPLTREKKSPQLFIFQSCVNLLWELPQYQWKKMGSMAQRNQREQARDFNDHLLDALRYMIMARFPAPEVKPLGDSMILPGDRTNVNMVSQPMGAVGDPELGQFETNTINTGITENYE